jgi:hypothetical protein
MGIDIRVPTGAMFTLLGALLAIAGVLSDQRSLGINVNLYWGAVMLVFGATMLSFGLRATRK